MEEKEFIKGIENIKEFLGRRFYEKIYLEKKDYGMKCKIYNVSRNFDFVGLYWKVRFYEEVLLSGEIQFYVVNRNGKRSIIIKWFDLTKENELFKSYWNIN